MYVQPDVEPLQQGEEPETSPRLANHASRSWAYIGSANLSESAWGKLTFDRSTKRPKLNCRNWECGVIVPVSRVGGSKGGLKMFDGTVPVPMQIPAPELNEDRKPWFFMER